jgi:SAM-dependent methyltransferase
VSERIDFSANATIYDRRHGAAVSDDGLDRLWVAAGLRAGGRVLDIGAGTGRVAIPLALRGCHVVAVEPARGMLDELRAKAGESKVQAVIAEGSRLPFPAGHFDCVVIARLLYLTPDWQAILREVHRVLARRGCFLHEWGNGHAAEEWVQIREEARRLFEEAGLRAPFHPGARSEADIDGQVGLLQFVREASVDMAPGPEITIREFLRRLVEGELSYIWGVPQDVRSSCIPRLERWSSQMFDLDRPISMPREIRWVIHRKI